MNPMRVQWKLRRVGDGYEGMVILPASLRDVVKRAPLPDLTRVPAQRATVVRDYRKARARVAKRQPTRKMRATGKSNTPGGALAQAAAGANRLLSNPLVQAAMPPGTAAAVKGLGIAASFAQSGKLQDAAKFIKGPGAKRLFGAIKSIF